ncbi:hypothetical protein Q31b_14430 [Novipirellula aureliae]|uniref:Uncharacterized protein n=1 Tax=Novipirellula aureliae TaxID=2527966 RepID=A0A5C6E8A3_9BACT|nr:hypothetical protein [Novipirellula aureliae]TWU43911.1 hypothetical protein Q31b_14430 [Novipirellula aureliae]
MNRKQVIQTIRRLHRRCEPLNLSAVKRDHPELVSAVYAETPYWGWKAALADAGLTYDKIRIYVRETTECRVCGRRFQNLTVHLRSAHEMSTEDYREEYPDAELVSERLREKLTGNSKRPPHPEFIPHWEPIYTAEYILDRINEYAMRGFWMDYETMTTIDCSLVGVFKIFLDPMSWDDVLRRIDIDPVEYRGFTRDSDFTLADFKQWLEDRESRGVDCTQVTLLGEYDTWHRRPRQFVWAMRRYGNWTAALEAAKVDFGKAVFGGHHYLTKESVLKEVRRKSREKADLSHTAVSLWPNGTQLTDAAARFFGNWTACLDAARVPQKLRVRRVNYETEQDVLEAIRYRLDHQYSLAPLDLYYGSRSDLRLWKKAFELFGSWRNAVKKAGGNSRQIREASQTPFSTTAKVTAELKKRNRGGRSLAREQLCQNEIDKQLYCMASGFFGTWQAAVRASGQDPKAYHQFNLEPIRKYVTEKQVVDEIRKRQKKDQPINVRGLTHGDATDQPLLYSARKLFGSWQAAIEAAGIEYDSVVHKQQDYEAMKKRTYRTYESRDEVIAELQRRHKEGIPLNHRAVSHGDDDIRDSALILTAEKFYGDWDKALLAAGIDLASVQPEWVRKRKAMIKRKAKQGRRRR